MEENLKRPKDVVFYNMETLQIEEEAQNDLLQMLSMICGVAAFMLKFKFTIWLAFTFFLANYTDQKTIVPNSRFLFNFSLLILAFILIYVFPS